MCYYKYTTIKSSFCQFLFLSLQLFCFLLVSYILHLVCPFTGNTLYVLVQFPGNLYVLNHLGVTAENCKKLGLTKYIQIYICIYKNTVNNNKQKQNTDIKNEVIIYMANIGKGLPLYLLTPYFY